jgi:hypothetical protein
MTLKWAQTLARERPDRGLSARMRGRCDADFHIFCFSLRKGCGAVDLELGGGGDAAEVSCWLLPTPSFSAAVAADGRAEAFLLRNWEEAGVPLKSIVNAARLLRSSSMRALLLADASSDACD